MNWFPTTPRQSALVYALNVLLLFNLTVVAVMLSGRGVIDWPGQDEAFAGERSAERAVDRAEPEGERLADMPAVVEPAVDPSAEFEPDPGFATPVTLVPESAEAGALSPVIDLEPITEPTAAAPVLPASADEPESEEPGINFFGVGID